MRALALGAQVLHDRPGLYLRPRRVGGPGVAKALDIIRNELSVTMGLCGVNTIAEIDDHVLAI